MKNELWKKNLKKTLGRFWPSVAVHAAGGLPWLSGPKAKSGMLGRPIGPVHGSTHRRGHCGRWRLAEGPGGTSPAARVRGWSGKHGGHDKQSGILPRQQGGVEAKRRGWRDGAQQRWGAWWPVATRARLWEHCARRSVSGSSIWRKTMQRWCSPRTGKKAQWWRRFGRFWLAPVPGAGQIIAWDPDSQHSRSTPSCPGWDLSSAAPGHPWVTVGHRWKSPLLFFMARCQEETMRKCPAAALSVPSPVTRCIIFGKHDKKWILFTGAVKWKQKSKSQTIYELLQYCDRY
jgi:hypothetical protein